VILINAIEIDECLASHLVGPDPFLRDQLISFSFPEFTIAAPVLKFDEPALLVVVVSHGSQSSFDDLSHRDQDRAAKAGIFGATASRFARCRVIQTAPSFILQKDTETKPFDAHPTGAYRRVEIGRSEITLSVLIYRETANTQEQQVLRMPLSKPIALEAPLVASPKQ
jgi:hypothetical protein